MKYSFLFCFAGSYGTLFPSIPVAQALKDKGHKVAYYTWRSFGKLIKKQGFEFFPTTKLKDGDMSRPQTTVWDDWKYQDPQQALNADVFGFILNTIPDQVADINYILKNKHVDVFVVDTMLYGPKLISELTKIPWAAFWHTPYSIPSKDLPEPKVKVPQQASQQYNQIRTQLRLPLYPQPLWNHRSSPYLDLIFSTTDFEYPRSDFPPQAHLVGSSFWEIPINTPLPKWIKQLPKDRPVILVNISSIYQKDLHIAKGVIEAMIDEKVFIIITLSGTHSLKEIKPISNNIKVVEYIPHSLILPHCNLVIFHGGHGTALKCLSYGVPMVVVPIGRDQFAVAERCVDSGVGIKIMPSEFSIDKLKQTIYKVLQNAKYQGNARKIQKAFTKTTGPQSAAQLLIKLAKTQRSIQH